MKNQYLEHVLVMLQKTEVKVKTTFSDLSTEQLNWKPNEKTWSIAECIDHLNASSQLYFSVFEDIKNNKIKPTFWTKLPFWKGFIGNLLLKSVDPETKRKVKTSKAFMPTQSNYDKNILDKYEEYQGKLIVYLHELDGYDHSNIVIPSPINKMLVYRLEDAFNILWKHQIRHFNQARNLMKQDGFPKS